MGYQTVRAAKIARNIFAAFVLITMLCAIFIQVAPFSAVIVFFLALQLDAQKSIELLELKEKISCR